MWQRIRAVMTTGVIWAVGWTPSTALFLLLLAADASAQGRLRLLDSATVVEPDSLPLALISRLAIGNRSYFVVDRDQQRVFEIDRRTLRVIPFGRKGSGPNEIRVPGDVAVSGDTLLSVIDHGQQKIQSWDLRTRKIIATAPLPNWLATISYHGGRLQLAAVTLDTSIVAAVSLTGESLTASGTLPLVFRDTPPLMSAFGTPHVAFDSIWVYAIFEIDEYLYRWQVGRRQGDVQLVPKVRRKGVRAALFSELVRDPSKAAELAYDRSIPSLLTRMRPGILGFVTLDGRLEKTRFIGEYHLTVMDLTRSRACADLRIPGERDPLPVIGLVGDTLTVVQQAIDASGLGTTYIKRFLVETAACRWMPLGPRSAVRN